MKYHGTIDNSIGLIEEAKRLAWHLECMTWGVIPTSAHKRKKAARLINCTERRLSRRWRNLFRMQQEELL